MTVKTGTTTTEGATTAGLVSSSIFLARRARRKGGSREVVEAVVEELDLGAVKVREGAVDRRTTVGFEAT